MGVFSLMKLMEVKKNPAESKKIQKVNNDGNSNSENDDHLFEKLDEHASVTRRLKRIELNTFQPNFKRSPFNSKCVYNREIVEEKFLKRKLVNHKN